MALPVTADFTGTNNTLIRSLTGWDGAGSAVNHGFKIASNQAQADASAGTGADWWTTDAFSNDQYSQATVAAIVANTYIGVAVRCGGTDGGTDMTAYLFYSDSADGSYIDKYVGGSFVGTLAGPGAVFAAGNLIRLEIVGNALTGKVGGVTRLSVTDSSSPITAGAAGICCNAAGNNSRIDDWEGGNLGAVATKALPARLGRALRVWVKRR